MGDKGADAGAAVRSDAVTDAQSRVPFSQVKSWFSGYAPGGEGAARHNAHWGGGPRYRKFLEEVEQDGYKTINPC